MTPGNAVGGLLGVFLRVVAEGFDPGLDAFEFQRRLFRAGWLAGDAGDGEVEAFQGKAQAVVQAAEAALDAALSTNSLEEVLQALDKARGVVDSGRAWAEEVGATLGSPGVGADLAAGLIGEALIAWLAREHPSVGAWLWALGVVRDVESDAVAVDGEPVTRSRLALPRLDMERVGQLLTAPLDYLQALVGAGWPETAEDAARLTAIAMKRLALLTTLLGGSGVVGLDESEGLDPSQSDPRTSVFVLPVSRRGADGGFDSSLVAAVEVVPSGEVSLLGQGGPGIEARLSGELGAEFEVGGWTAAIDAQTDGVNFFAGPGGVLPVGVNVTAPSVEVTLRRPPSQEARVIGGTGGSRIEIHGVELVGRLWADDQGVPHAELGVLLRAARLFLVPSDLSVLLERLAPSSGLEAEFDVGLRLDPGAGLRMTGSTALEAVIPLDIDVGGVVRIPFVNVGAQVGAGEAALTVEMVMTGGFGPVRLSLERFGLAVTARALDLGNLGPLDLGLRVLPPAGAALRIAAGPVTGGGHLMADRNGRFLVGAAELFIKPVGGAKAVGLLLSELPDGSEGVALLLLLTADFPAIPLGLGFTLSGAGGLVGVNRTFNSGALRENLKRGVLDAVLFPPNPTERPAEVLRGLESVFPAAGGRHVFGVMARLGWGPNRLLDIDVAMVLELPMPLKIALLGRAQLALPSRDLPIVHLRMDVLGLLDLDRGEASVDAQLIDSRLAVFSIGGAVALRVGWGRSTYFLLSAGGFNPHFESPPEFPSLDRLSIGLGSDNPRIRLEAYLAITSNSLQVGARLDVYAAAKTFVGTFSVRAWAGFDALIQIDPFRFRVDLDIGAEIAHNGNPILGVRLYVTLEGPTPWHIAGFAELSILFITIRIGVSLTIGDGQQERLPEIDVVQEVARPAFTSATAWVAELPAGLEPLVTLRAVEGAELVLHPLGALVVRQRDLPIGLEVRRFGSFAATEPVEFEISSVVVGTRTFKAAELIPVRDEFAPGQFLDLTDDEKLARPSFESMRSGVRLTQRDDPQMSWPGDDKLVSSLAELDYDEVIVDDAEPLKASVLVPIGIALALSGAGATAMAGTRNETGVRFASAAGPEIVVLPEAWLVTDVVTLQPGGEENGGAVSCAEAHARGGGADGTQVSLAYEGLLR